MTNLCMLWLAAFVVSAVIMAITLFRGDTTNMKPNLPFEWAGGIFLAIGGGGSIHMGAMVIGYVLVALGVLCVLVEALPNTIAAVRNRPVPEKIVWPRPSGSGEKD